MNGIEVALPGRKELYFLAKVDLTVMDMDKLVVRDGDDIVAVFKHWKYWRELQDEEIKTARAINKQRLILHKDC